MSKTGPKTQPDAVKKQKGTFRSDRASNDPDVIEGTLSPKEMSSTSIDRAYGMFQGVFEEVGILSKQHSFSLWMLAREWTYFRAICKKLTHGKITYEKTSSTSKNEQLPKLNPLTKEYDASFKRLKGMLSEFGATPSSQASVSKMVKEADAADELLKLFADRFKDDEFTS